MDAAGNDGCLPPRIIVDVGGAALAAGLSRPEPVTTPATIAAYSVANQRRILDACPHASDVRSFHGWLKRGRVVMKGQKGIRIVAPDAVEDGKVRSIKAVHVFDVSQTQECPTRRLARHDRSTD